jgi:DNA-binding GntR family transcriptional regulator
MNASLAICNEVRSMGTIENLNANSGTTVLERRIERRPLHEEVVDRLRDRIVQSDLAPGTRLNERVLCEQLGISRTPLREAIKILATEGLVELLPNRGAIVTPLKAANIADTLAVMGSLESLAGELACAKAEEAEIAEIRALHFEMLAHHARGDLAGYFKYNQLIHLKIIEASGNPVLTNTYRQLNANVRRARYMANLSQERWDAAVREHEEILGALASRDAVRLKRLLAEHLAHKVASVMAALEQSAAAAA